MVIRSLMPEEAPSDWVYKVCSRGAWKRARAEGHLEPSSDDRRDGYIHLSTRGQLAATLERHFTGVPGLVVLAVRASELEPGALRWEPSRGGQRFPHLYGELAASKVHACFELVGPVEELPLPG